MRMVFSVSILPSVSWNTASNFHQVKMLPIDATGVPGSCLVPERIQRQDLEVKTEGGKTLEGLQCWQGCRETLTDHRREAHPFYNDD
ncbi:uncharacterized protein LOC105083008 [Camelus bactrianus]|uniref:Uncharacterized protein LOC105083008 n=1 Tax=Camelus bactrianus TaxID=9837 RepID=A0A9W3FPV0_CAMBA